MRWIDWTLAGAVMASLLACGGAVESETGGEAIAAAEAGVPVPAPQGPVDEELAERGEELFTTKGCVACHTLGKGRLVGPDLQGVAGRRSFAWTYHMVTSPDSMTRADSIAMGLMAQYMTPMSDMNVQPEEFRAIYEYLRQGPVAGEAGEAAAETE